MATLKELDTWYTLEEAHQMREALFVNGYNEWLANKRIALESKRQH